MSSELYAISSNVTSGTIRMQKYGNIRIIIFENVIFKDSGITLTLADTDIPLSMASCVLYSNTSPTYTVCRLWLRTDGTVGLMLPNTAANYSGELVYIV